MSITTQKVISIKNFFINCDQISWKLRIWLHLLKESYMENFIFCADSLPVWNQHVKGNSSSRMSCRKVILNALAKYPGKHLWQSPFLIKLLTLACSFMKKVLPPRYFFENSSVNNFFSKQLWKTAFEMKKITLTTPWYW